jgi:4-amino-4-deoxy-L-arabinose transferase-like glycosyltransferase
MTGRPVRNSAKTLQGTQQRFRESTLGGPWAALAVILAGAAALRIVGIAYGRPFPLFSPDEQSIVPRAWHMVHGGGIDPHWFDYPTFLMYLIAPFQAWAGAPSYLTARIVVLVLALGAVAASWWLGSRAYGGPAGAVAAAVVAVETTAVAYSRMAVTDVPLMLGVALALALLVRGDVELGGFVAGLATSFKYPGVLLVVPLAVAGYRQPPRLAIGLTLAVVAFCATSPFVIAHLPSAAADAYHVQSLAHRGWLGFEHDHIAPIAFIVRLWHGLGPAMLVCVLGVGVAVARRTRADLILVSFVGIYFIHLCTLGAHFDRYLLPLLPPLGALAGRMRGLAPVTLLLLVVPLTWSIRDARELTKTDTRVVAHRWIEQTLPHGAQLAVDSSLTPFVGFRVLKLQLPLPGEDRPDPNRNLGRLRDRGYRYAVVTGAIADRVLAARKDYPSETAFYEALKKTKRVFYVPAGGRYAGPWVAVYHFLP